MLLYPLEEAAELLSSKLASAKKSLGEVGEDLEWIREQVTVMEVNFARVHNVSNDVDCADASGTSRGAVRGRATRRSRALSMSLHCAVTPQSLHCLRWLLCVSNVSG